jgi:MFS family permease
MVVLLLALVVVGLGGQAAMRRRLWGRVPRQAGRRGRLLAMVVIYQTGAVSLALASSASLGSSGQRPAEPPGKRASPLVE